MDGGISIAIISAASVTVGSLTTAVIQYLLTKAGASREEKRLRRNDFRNRFEEYVTKLIEETDPDIHAVPSIPEITRNLIKLQLYLNLEDDDQKKLNGSVNALGRSVAGYSTSRDKTTILQNQSAVIDHANKILRKL
jgi:hypothetical protein